MLSDLDKSAIQRVEVEQITSYLVEARNFVNKSLLELSLVEGHLLNGLKESIDYTLLSNGKKIRPVLCLMVGELFGVAREKLVSVVCALEMIHTASLIIDDIPSMDNAKIRRKKSANHLVFGQEVSTLAGIALLTRAYEIVLNAPQLSVHQRLRIVRRLVQAVGPDGMVGGQFVDLKYISKQIDFTVLEYVHLRKTASLFIAAAEIGAIAGDASAKEIVAISGYAKNLGLAFQIRDDLLDYLDTLQGTGKTLQKGGMNFVTILGTERAKSILNKCVADAIDAIDLYEGRDKKLRALVRFLLNVTIQ